MDDFEKELKAGFLEEATQLLSDAEQCFLSLEASPDDQGLLDKIFRLAHNLKGSSKAVGFDQVGAFAHIFESFLLKVKNGEVQKTSGVISLLLRCNDHLNLMVEALKGDLGANIDSAELTAELEAGIRGELKDGGAPAPAEAVAEEPAAPVMEASPAEPTPAVDPTAQPNAEEIAALMAAETDKHLEKEIAEQSKAAAPVAAPVAAHAPAPAAPAAAKPKAGGAATEESIRVSLTRLEKLLNFVGEMVILQTVLREQANSNNQQLLRRTVHQLGKVTKEVQDISMSLRMVPVKQTFQKMQRIVRDTANLLGKKVQLHLSGEETELDKTVLENISDPLVHLIRNAVDHGIESSAKRLEKGKSEEGNVYLGAYHQAGKLVIEIRDDGGGIDPNVLRKKAEEKGILRPGQTLSDRDAVHLIFHPGFSTKQEVTEVSGRGVGMDVVKTNIEALQGEVHIETEVGKGTCFKVSLPLTLAIIDGMVVRCGEERFVIPLSQVHESVQPSKEDIQFNVGLSETLVLRDEAMPLVRLGLTLGRRTVKPAWECIAIVIRSTGRPFAILVDDIIGQYQIVIKKLGPELSKLKAFSGSAVLGDGKPALIIEPSEIASMSKPIKKSDIAIVKTEGAAA